MSTAEQQPTEQVKTVAVSGSTGMVGSRLCRDLEAEGLATRRLVRHQPEHPQQEILWNPAEQEVDSQGLGEVDAVVHLAGENISSGRWTEAKKRRIRASRVEGTRLLCEGLAKGERRPETLVCASAIGYYGDRGDELMTEDAPPGEGLLAEVCRDWEAATAPASDAGIRVVNVRIGVILCGQGGALAKMVTPFKLGAGGVIGSGQQYMSWIAIDDVIGGIRHALSTPSLAGPVNLVSPSPVTNREFTRTLGKVLHRPTVMPLPTFAAKLVFGEMGEELLLSSTRVEPEKLKQSGYQFAYPKLEEALRHVLDKEG